MAGPRAEAESGRLYCCGRDDLLVGMLCLLLLGLLRADVGVTSRVFDVVVLAFDAVWLVVAARAETGRSKNRPGVTCVSRVT